MNLNEELERGAQAARIVSSPIYRDAFKSVEQAIHDLWADCPIRDREGAHELRLQLQLLRDVEAVLTAAIENGQVAKDELERRNRRVISPLEWKGS